MDARSTMTRKVTIVPSELSLGAAWEIGIVTSTDLLALVIETQSATILPFELTLHTPAA